MAEKQWTKEQKQAIEAETGTLLVAAAAGSGKTSVLVERIVRKLTAEADPCPPDGLLVVTFTNAAAAEMRTRIFARIKEKSRTEPERATFFRALTARLGEMQVCTMDAYCMQLVREHFSDCDLMPDFEILDEGEEKALKSLAVRETVEERFVAGAPAFLSLTRLFDAGRDDAGLIDGILALSDFSMSEPVPEAWLKGVADHFSPCPAMDTVWGKLIKNRIEAGVAYCLRLAEDALDDIAHDETLEEKCGPLFTVLRDDMREAAAGAASAKTWDTLSEVLANACAAASAGRFPSIRGMGDDPYKNRAKSKRDAVKKVLSELCDLVCATEEENTEDVSVLAPAAGALIDATLDFNARLLAAKKERNRYGFSDIAHFALDLLYDPDSPDKKTPLAAELGAGLREILIDEYQDTNRAQDALFYALSQSGDNMFMVGDVKQSIYRFRLASPEIFIEKYNEFPHFNGESRRSKIILGQNFRSRENVTATVNDVFTVLMSPDCGEIDYNEDERLYFGASYYPPAEDTATEVYFLDPGDRDDTAAEADFCADLIKKRLENGQTVYDTELKTLRPARGGDFCILLRSARGAADVYAAALRARGLRVNTDSRTGFFESAELRMVLALLTVIDNPQKDVELLAALLSPLFGFSPEEAAKIRNDARDAGAPKCSLFAAVSMAAQAGDEKSAGFLEQLSYYRKLGATLSCAELIGALYDETPLLAIAGAMTEGKLRVANLRALYEAAQRFSADGAKTVGAFLRYLAMLKENGAQLQKGSAAPDDQSVTVMTMHRSKGLEFPFVILGGLGRKFNLRERSNVLTVSHEFGVGLKRREPENIKLYDTLSSKAVRLAGKTAALSEEMRILYVALTRAKEKLILLATCEKPWEQLAKTEALLPETGPVPPFAVSGAEKPFKWLASVCLRHPGAASLRQLNTRAGAGEGQIRCAVVAVPPEEEAKTAPAPVPADPALVEALRARMAFSYPWLPVSGLRAKHTASSLAEERFSPAHFAAAAPAFLFSDELTPAEKGTATHRFLECCRFEDAEKDAEKELRRLVASEKLTERESAGVELDAVRGFFTSDLFSRIKKSAAVLREYRFTVAKSVRDLNPDLPEIFRNEQTVIDGKTDLIFVEDGAAVIVDYKTDRVRDPAELVRRYTPQMRLYAEAAAQVLGMPVKECLLYSLTLRRAIII